MARRRDAFDRLDAHGVISHRAWLFSEDEHGNQIKATPVGFEGMHVHESRHYAPVPEGDKSDREYALELRTRAATHKEMLSDLEEFVAFHQGKLPRWKDCKEWVSIGDLPHMLDDGGVTLLQKEGTRYQEREGMPTLVLVCVEVVRFAQWDPLDLEGIALRATSEFGREVSVDQVRRAVTSYNRKRPG